MHEIIAFLSLKHPVEPLLISVKFESHINQYYKKKTLQKICLI